MPRAERWYARVSHRLAHRPGTVQLSRLHAWLIRRTAGRVGSRFFRAELLVLRTVGRRSGRPREAPLIYVAHGDGWAVVAANAASARPPAWWLNLQADPDAEVVVDGRTVAVRARRAKGAEAAELRTRLRAVYDGLEHYERRSRRELPIVVLEPRVPS